MNFRSLAALTAGLGIALSTSAQFTVEVGEAPVNMSLGEKPAFVIQLGDADIKDVEKDMKKTFKDYKGKATGKMKEEILFDDLEIKAMSDNTVDVYVKMYEVGRDVRINAFFDLGGIYLSRRTHPDEADVAVDIMERLGYRYRRTQVGDELDEQQDILQNREQELEALIKETEKLHKDIAAAERNISRIQKDIADNEVDQERKRAEIETQKSVLVKIGDALGDEKKVAEKTLKGLERDLRKIENDHEKLHRKIEGHRSDIAGAEREIEKNRLIQKSKKAEVAQQKEVVREVEGRLADLPEFK